MIGQYGPGIVAGELLENAAKISNMIRKTERPDGRM